MQIPRKYIVFVSSAQNELSRERQGLWELMTAKDRALMVHTLPQIFEFNITGKKHSVTDNWENAVLKADVYLGIFDRRYSQASVNEYNVAREDKTVRKEFLIFIRKRLIKDPRLSSFLKKIKDLREGHACIEYRDYEDLLCKARHFLLSYVMKRKEGCVLSKELLGEDLDMLRQFSFPEKERRALLRPFGRFLISKALTEHRLAGRGKK